MTTGRGRSMDTGNTSPCPRELDIIFSHQYLIRKTSQYRGGTPRSAPRVAPGGPYPPYTEFFG